MNRKIDIYILFQYLCVYKRNVCMLRGQRRGRRLSNIWWLVKEFCFSCCLSKVDIITENSVKKPNLYKTRLQNRFSNRLMYILHSLQLFNNFLLSSVSSILDFLSFPHTPFLSNTLVSLSSLYAFIFYGCLLSTSQIFSSLLFFWLWAAQKCVSVVLTNILKIQPPHV